MRDIDIIDNSYCKEVTLEEAKELLKWGRTIEVRIYDEKDRIKYWEKYNAKCNPHDCWSLIEVTKGRFFLVVDQGV